MLRERSPFSGRTRLGGGDNSLDMVIVMTAGNYEYEAVINPYDIMESYVLASVQWEGVLPVLFPRYRCQIRDWTDKLGCTRHD